MAINNCLFCLLLNPEVSELVDFQFDVYLQSLSQTQATTHSRDRYASLFQ